jgi:xanthine dehydrogenase accessory factor
MNNIINALIRPDGSVYSCVLVTIIAHEGSSPRSGGSRMVVYPDRTIYGTIGGGRLEAEVITAAGAFFSGDSSQHLPFAREFHFSGTDAASMDMICGGEVNVLFEYIDPQDETKKEILCQIKKLSKRKESGWFVLEFNPTDGIADWGILTNHSTWGTVGLTSEQVQKVQAFQSIVMGEKIINIERLDQCGNVLIFGAGHVGQSIARLCSMVDFRTIVIDDRSEYANPDRFPTADQIITPANLKEVFSELSIDEFAYIVIVTRGHLQDQIVVEWALKTNAGYIGMIGSRRKWRLLRMALEEQGFNQNDFARIYTPIGIEIGAETPEEIGISIVAELIRCRAKKKIADLP